VLSEGKEAPAVSSIRDIPLENICEAASNPRRAFDDGQLRELAENITLHGVLQAILVRPSTAPTNWWLAGVVSAVRSLIAFTAWSSFAHALVMGTMAFQFANQPVGFLWGSVVLAVIGVALIVLAPAKASAAFASAPAD